MSQIRDILESPLQKKPCLFVLWLLNISLWNTVSIQKSVCHIYCTVQQIIAKWTPCRHWPGSKQSIYDALGVFLSPSQETSLSLSLSPSCGFPPPTFCFSSSFQHLPCDPNSVTEFFCFCTSYKWNHTMHIPFWPSLLNSMLRRFIQCVHSSGLFLCDIPLYNLEVIHSTTVGTRFQCNKCWC